MIPALCAPGDGSPMTSRSSGLGMKSTRLDFTAKPPKTRVEALVFGLRNGLAALPKNPDRLRWLSELNAEQLKAVCRRVQNFNPEIATPWSSEEVVALITKWRELHA